MSLSSLPSLCLLIILDRIPLRDLLSTVNLVCHRWAQLRPVACHRRHSLLLYDNHKIIKQEFDQYEWICPPEIEAEVVDSDGKAHFGIFTHFNALRLPELSDRVCQQLVTQLPAITKLKIGQTVKWWPTVVQHVNQLLEKWSPKLVHCSLWLFNEHQVGHINGYSPKLIDSLFDLLNQLTSLARLSIYLAIPSSPLLVYHGVDSHKLSTSLCPTLTRVEHFDYGWTMKDQFDEHIYRDIELALKGQSSLKTIGLHPITPLVRVIQFSPRFIAKLTNYRLKYKGQCSATDVLTMLARFYCLHTLTLNGIHDRLNQPFAQLISRLSHLTQLTLLKFYGGFNYFFRDQLLPTEVPQIEMPSVKALLICFSVPFSHSHIDRLSIPELFPNVQVIKLRQSIGLRNGRPPFVTCQDCDYHLMDVYEQVEDNGECQRSLLHNCARQSFKSLKQCLALRRIYFIRKCCASNVAESHVFSCNFTWDQI